LQGFCGRRFLIVAATLSIRDNQALSVGFGLFRLNAAPHLVCAISPLAVATAVERSYGQNIDPRLRFKDIEAR
jgi:hypothetical protein